MEKYNEDESATLGRIIANGIIIVILLAALICLMV